MSVPAAQPSIDELLERAVEAINHGDRTTADALAGQVLAVDRSNSDAEELLAAPTEHGEIRRLTILFADLVDSTALSTKVEPEIYRTVVGRYRDEVLRIVNHYEGHVGSTKGDGLLAIFGHPRAHEDDVGRAVQAGLDITRAVSALSKRVQRRFGFDIDVRVGVHRGIVYLDTAQDDVYGFAANLAARMCSIAEPGTLAISDAVAPLVEGRFELESRLPKRVRGVDTPVGHYRVVTEREMTRGVLGPLVGRHTEMTFLQHSWARAVAGELRKPGVAFRGDAGIGKSRLGWSAVDMAERTHAVVLQLIGSPFHTDVGLRPVRRLLERRCAIGPKTDPAERLRHLRAELEACSPDAATMLPLLAPVLGIDPQSGYQPVPAEGRKLHDLIVAAARDYLLACVHDVPALILVEDMHWFDASSVEVVRSVLDADLRGHVLVVMTGREQVSFPGGQRVETFDLTPLTDGEADQLIVALHPAIAPQDRRTVRRRCDGIPLFIEEVVAKLREQPSDESTGVPDTLYEALFARLRSSAEAVLVVEAAAVIGGRIDRALLQSVAGLPERDVDAVLEQLTTARVLEPLGADTWRFRHELLREVAAELSPPTVRRTLHGRIADALVAAAPDGNPDWPVIAHHYERADRYFQAALSYAQASSHARRRGALTEARSLLTHAVTQVERSTPGPERDRSEIGLRLRRGFLAMAAEGAGSPNATADYERCLQLTGTDLGDDEFFSTLVALYPYYAIRADLHRVDQLLESVRNSLSGARDWFRPYNDAGFGMAAWYRGQFDSALEQLEAAAASRNDQAAQAVEAVWFMPNEASASIYTHLAIARYMKGDLAGAEEEFAKTERYCAGLDFPQGAFSLAYAQQLEVLMRIEAGQLERAAEIAAVLAADGERHGFDSWTMVGAAQQTCVAALASVAARLTDHAVLAQHVAAITGFVDAWRALQVRCWITSYDGFLARLLLVAGQPAAARDRVGTALACADETGMHYYDAELLRIRAHAQEDADRRRSDLTAALQLARQQGATIFELRIAADIFDIEGEAARAALLDAVDHFPDGSSWPELDRARALLA